MVNRQRFLGRYKQQIKKAVLDAIAKRSITDIEKGEVVSIPARDLSEPRFKWGQGGVVERVFPGNREYLPGDVIPRPSSQSGQGSDSSASDRGEGEDAFSFQLTKEEFLELYFEDLALPDLVRKELGLMKAEKSVRAGIVSSGMPVNINIVRSMRQAAGRRMALSASYRRKLHDVESALADLKEDKEDQHQREKLALRLEVLKRKVKAIPFIDTIDLRYNHRVRVMVPSTQAVMFCIMDVSGSMDEMKKEIAKQFFILLYLFLTKNYENIELVFIRHHTSAKEVDEQTFFYARETGGTVVSSALELLGKLIEERYSPNAWNIYVAQASDGDNWNADSPYCQRLLQEKIMSYVQYFAYVEIMPRHHQSLWEAYKLVQAEYPNFAMQHIEQAEQIYPVFRSLFERKSA
jgi:uncharacterized protein